MNRKSNSSKTRSDNNPTDRSSLSLNSQPEARHCLTAQPTNNERERHQPKTSNTPLSHQNGRRQRGKKTAPGPPLVVESPLRNLILSPRLSPFPPSRHVGLLVGGKLNNHHTSQFPSCCSKHTRDSVAFRANLFLGNVFVKRGPVAGG
jgi:hypothetical protein